MDRGRWLRLERDQDIFMLKEAGSRHAHLAKGATLRIECMRRAQLLYYSRTESATLYCSCSNEVMRTTAQLLTICRSQGIYGLDFSHNGKTVAIAVGDSKMRILAMPAT